MKTQSSLAPDFQISSVLTGLWQIADLERDGKTLDPNATAAFMQAYWDNGFTSFDMADHYGSAEIIAGTFKKQLPPDKKVQLLTKWVPPPGKVTKDTVRKAVEKSLHRLQVDCIDLLQYHAWNYSDPIWIDTLFWLQELKEESLIAHLGLTNFDAAHLRIAAASGVNIVSNQISFSLLDQRATREMKAVCEEYDIKILAFGTLAGGFLSERWLGKNDPKEIELSTWSQMKYKRFIDVAGGWDLFQNLLHQLQTIAQNHNVSIANVSSAFMLEYSHVAGIILGARLGVSEHIQENLSIYNIELTQEEKELIRNAIEKLNPIPGGCGDEYRKPPFLTASGDLSHHLNQIPAVYESISDTNNLLKIDSGTSWESMAGYSRANRIGDRILVSGTTATHDNKLIGGNDASAQTHFVLDKIQAAVESLGGELEDIVRTRIYVNNLNDWEAVARAHGDRFANIRPVNTLVEARLVGEGYLVEIEAEAIVPKK